MTTRQQRAISDIRAAADNGMDNYDLTLDIRDDPKYSFVEIRGDRRYKKPNRVAGDNCLNDTSFQLFIGPRGGIRGTIYPMLCKTQKVTTKSLYLLHIY